MVSMLIRGVIIYAVVIVAVRLMGKRQIGELQPAELVITILLSQVASVPLQSAEIPLLSTLVIIFLLIALEIIFSVVSMKCKGIRTLLQGSPVMIICEGELLVHQLKKVRYTVEDLIQALRQKEVFDIADVQYAFVETNGSVSVLLKNEQRPVVISDTDIEAKSTFMPCLVISDGKIIRGEFPFCGMTDAKIKKILRKENLTVSQVMLMTAGKDGRYNIIRKAERQ